MSLNSSLFCEYLSIYISIMDETQVFKSGNSLAVRLPKKFTLPIGPVSIHEEEGRIILVKPKENWPDLRKLFPPDPEMADWPLPDDEPEENPKNLEWS